MEVTAKDVRDFECHIGESLIDSNGWVENEFTIIGYFWGTDPRLGRLFTDHLDIHPINNALNEELIIEDLYYACYASLINAIPEYKERWLETCDNHKFTLEPKCECGNYVSYASTLQPGVCFAAMQPLDSCINCYGKESFYPKHYLDKTPKEQLAERLAAYKRIKNAE